MTKAQTLNDKRSINPMWILCNNESTVDIIKNKNMLTNIRPTNNPVEITGIGRAKIRVNHIKQ